MINKYDVVASAYGVYAYREDKYVLDYPQLFSNRNDAVNFMKETYGTDIKPMTERHCDAFVDSNGNWFYVGLINTYGRR